MEAKLQQQAPQKAQANKTNLTGIPTQMKLDFEQRSGLSFDDVQVHYNSDKPAQLQALAYTQGTQIYVGPGQEQHLPHELGHVIQQKSRKMHPTHSPPAARTHAQGEGRPGEGGTAADGGSSRRTLRTAHQHRASRHPRPHHAD